jgi:2-oxoglutarate ferredoxin oxidoreductase subunit alpha
MGKSFLWKIGGEAGFGIMTIGLLFSKIASRMGYHIFDYAEYPSLIRGGHNTTETIVSDKPVFFTKKEVDLLVCLNRDAYELHKHRLHKDSVVVYDKSSFTIEDAKCHLAHLPLREILEKEKGSMVMINNVAIGASLAAMGWDLTILNQMIADTFAKKGEEVIRKNQVFAKDGFDYIRNNYPKFCISLFPQIAEEDKLILTGNDSFSLGTIAADCRLYVAYPMTPSSTVLSTLADFAKKTGMVVRHAEDEISVINTALGGSFAGVRSAVGTSGGGFALMTESVSFAGVSEIPVVIFLSQRPGPATGLPTWTEQGDLLFAVHSGHGEFPKIVLTPGDIEEMYELTAEAFDLADIYQTPVIVMSDKLLSESHWSVSKQKFELWSRLYHEDRGKIVSKLEARSGKYLRYKITDDGISPMLIPGYPGTYYQSNSYEHVEDGHTTEEAVVRINQVNKRNRKEEQYIKNHFKMPKIIGDIDSAEFVFVSWGGNKGAIKAAMEQLSNRAIKAAYIHFTHVYPMDEEKVKALFSPKKQYILIENNSHGQFGRLLRQLTGINIDKKLLKYDGRPIWVEEIIEFVNNF